MIVNMYEVFDEFEEANTRAKKIKVLGKYDSPFLRQVLKLAFDKQYEFYITEIPESYKIPDTLPGIRYAGLNNELRKLYLFRKGDPVADKLTSNKREVLFLQIAESIEAREMEVLMGIMRKDLGVSGLTEKLVRELFPGLLS